MPDKEDDGIDEAFEGFGEDQKPTVEVPKEEPKKEEEDADKSEPAGSESKDPAEPNKEVDATPADNDEDGENKPADPAKSTEPETSEKTPEPVSVSSDATQPLTKEDVAEVIADIQNKERSSGRELEITLQEIMDAYYPDGLTNTLVDESSGKKFETPQDVVDASGGQMSTEEAASWLMNEQFKLDKQVETIKKRAKDIAETTVRFKHDSETVIKKYEPLFKWQPSLQKKVYDKLISLTKVDKEKGVILEAPDVLDHYDFYLEPYQKAYEFSQNKPATNPEEPAEPKPTAEDRMDVSGDAAPTPVDDPNDFAQQVSKELAKGI